MNIKLIDKLCFSCLLQKEKNWPRCRPILYHNIAKEVPAERRGLVTRGYIAWILEASGFIFGWIVVTLM